MTVVGVPSGPVRPTPSTQPSVPVPDASNTPPSPPVTAAPSRHGVEIGSGSVGPAIESPKPWPTLTIYVDAEPGALLVDFAPPNPDCIAAEATATIGRGGAILVSLWVEDAPTLGESCTGGADDRQVRISLSEPVGDRRIYTSTVPEVGPAAEAVEQLADKIIGMDAAEAIRTIHDRGFEVRYNTDAEAVDDDYNTNRINIWVTEGVIKFAAVY